MGSENSKSKKANCDGEHLPEEEDDEVRGAYLYLGKAQLLSDGERSGPVNHWFLAIKFEDDCWVTLEANNYYGKLVPMYNKVTSQPDGDLVPMDKVLSPDSMAPHRLLLWPFAALTRLDLPDIFYIRISPRQLRNIAANHRDNNTEYVLLSNNCQTWVKHAANRIDSVRS